MAQITLSFSTGIMQPTFLQQVKKMKLDFDKDELQKLQKQRESVYYLGFGSIISEKTATAALKKIVNKLVSHLVRKNKLKRAV